MLTGTTTNIFQGMKERLATTKPFHREQKAIYGIHLEVGTHYLLIISYKTILYSKCSFHMYVRMYHNQDSR